jgi:hypothetical protein
MCGQMSVGGGVFMGEDRIRRNKEKRSLMVYLAGILLLASLGGCAGEPMKPAATVTPDQVRGHADKAFEKLKLEEQHRATGSGPTP